MKARLQSNLALGHRPRPPSRPRPRFLPGSDQGRERGRAGERGRWQGEHPTALNALRHRRILLIAAHPDDEVIGAGGQLSRWRNLHLIHVTDGAPRDLRDARAAGFLARKRYALARRRELERALCLAGQSSAPRRELGFVDQEASFHLVELTRALFEAIRADRPEVVLTHAYEGGHPDHDATAFAVHAACHLLRQQAGAAWRSADFPVRSNSRPASSVGQHAVTEPVPGSASTSELAADWKVRAPATPQLLEMTSYHNRAGIMVSGEFLPCADCQPITLRLSPRQQGLKRRLLGCFTTQHRTLSAFRLECERFREAPHYDFTQPPHPGPLYYERFEWGTTGAQWRRLASAALLELGLLEELVVGLECNLA